MRNKWSARRRAESGGERERNWAPSLSSISVAVLGLLLSACAVGPRYQAPELPEAASSVGYTPEPLPQQTASAAATDGVAQRFALGQDIPEQWWTLYGSDALNQLIKQALSSSPNLAAAQAALRQAQEVYTGTSASLLTPNVNAQLGAGRERIAAVSSSVPGGFTTGLYNAQVNVAYSVDVFGGNYSAVEAQQASVDFQRYQLEATYLALSSNVVTAAISEASLREQIKALGEVLDAQLKQQAVIEQQFAVGAVGLSPVIAQRSAVAATQAQIPPLEKSLDVVRHQLSVLVGRLPGEQGMPRFELGSLHLPQELPVSVPSELVRQRPDIRASEAQLHQAAALANVATANLYPQFNLTASLGSEALKSSQLFSSGWGFWSLIGGVTQPIFDGGALKAKQRAAQAALDVAAARYRSTLLQAFQNVADSLRALQADANTLQAQALAEQLAKESLDLTATQYDLGAVSYLALLDSQRTYLQAHIGLVNARAARFADTAALFQAMGGGWWNRSADLPQVSLNNPKRER